jgi:hypothetical protein
MSHKITISLDTGPGDDDDRPFDFYTSDCGCYISDMDGWHATLEDGGWAGVEDAHSEDGLAILVRRAEDRRSGEDS